ncbi:MAG: M14 family zinc carboxypeptidase [Kiritimatiellae bacterium]|nr:M14 family zinc carboxypeptidase [Kiritimatiellia bacterium]
MKCSARGDIQIDANYPGGNIAVERIEGDHVYLHQEIRDTSTWWFYWNFRVRGAQNRQVTFHFTNKSVFDRQGPSISRDKGVSWSWLRMGVVKKTTFTYTFKEDEKDIRFAYSIPYQESDLQRFLAQHANNKNLEVKELCETRKGRSVEQIRVGNIKGNSVYQILLTCRHHSCESPASYVLEGMISAMLSESEDGAWFRENVEVLIVPFMDKDGVEKGDQGKNRKPHDHNRDYDAGLYPSVRALRKLVPLWSRGKVDVAIDIHSPYVRNNTLYLVGNRNSVIWKEQCAFSTILENIKNKALPYKASSNIPFGKSWNNENNYRQGCSCSGWTSTLEGMRLATTIEVPYGNAGDTAITQGNTREFGASLVSALRLYLGE